MRNFDQVVCFAGGYVDILYPFINNDTIMHVECAGCNIMAVKITTYNQFGGFLDPNITYLLLLSTVYCWSFLLLAIIVFQGSVAGLLVK